MIRINLLPAEMRRGNRLPARVIAAAFLAAIVSSASVGWFGLVYFGDLTSAEERLADYEGRLSSMQKQVVYQGELEKNKKDYAARVQTIQDIAKSRRLWSKFCDELIDIVNNNGDTDRHLAWFSGIAVKADPKKGTTVTMPGSVQGEEKSRIANLHEDLEGAPFAAEIDRSDPSFKLDIDKKRKPAESLSFPLVLQFKPPAQPAKGKGKK
ncbi:MAG: hypothetical protein H6838_19565 [Planctomycetes bacterium]|nr:hypothetical protein [Planctomycetota bacterium]